MKNEEINRERMKPGKTASAFYSLHSFQQRRRSCPAGLPPHSQNPANAPQIPSAICLKISQKINRIRKSFKFKLLRCPDFAKKMLSNPPDFPIFIVNCTAWCRGKQDLP